MTDAIPGWDDMEEIDASQIDDVAIPGSRPRVDHTVRRQISTSPLLPEGWDSQPRTYRVDGVDRELFDIDSFMQATGLKYGTIRQWERNGVLPKPLMRSPRKDGVPGHRLYTREYVVGVATILAEEQVSDSRRNVRQTNFIERVRDLFERTGG